ATGGAVRGGEGDAGEVAGESEGAGDGAAGAGAREGGRGRAGGVDGGRQRAVEPGRNPGPTMMVCRGARFQRASSSCRRDVLGGERGTKQTSPTRRPPDPPHEHPAYPPSLPRLRVARPGGAGPGGTRRRRREGQGRGPPRRQEAALRRQGQER